MGAYNEDLTTKLKNYQQGHNQGNSKEEDEPLKRKSTLPLEAITPKLKKVKVPMVVVVNENFSSSMIIELENL